MKRESVFLRCDADDPIVVSDDETREELTQVSKQVSKGNKSRESGSVSSKDARSGTIRGDGLAEASTEDSVANKELNGNGGSVDQTELPLQSGIMPSREDLYYDEADREKLASWAEFPREVELAKRYEMVLRDRQRQELLRDQSQSPAGSAGRGRLRSRLSRRVGNFSEEEASGGEAGREKKVVNSVSGKKGRRRRVLYSGDDGSNTDGDGVSKAGVTPGPKSVFSSRAILGRRGKSGGGETMAPFLKPRPRRSSGGVVGVWE